MEEKKSWEEKKLTGNLGEDIVEFLINSAPNWSCTKFGVENHISDLKKMVRKEINSSPRKLNLCPTL